MELQTGDQCTSACVYFVLGSKVATLSVALYWVTTLALVTPEVKIKRNAYGVYFNLLGSIEVATDTWTHIFDLQLPNMAYFSSRTTTRFTCYDLPTTSNIKTCPDNNTFPRSVSILHQRAETIINNLIKSIYTTLKLEKAGRKKQRHGKQGLFLILWGTFLMLFLD